MSLRTAKIISLLVTVMGLGVVWQGSIFRGLGNQQGYQPVQPINFSHKVHAGDNQIQCLYCHSSADKSAVAGIPSATTCMNCHKQVLKDSPEIQKIVTALQQNRPIEWIKINDLPDHVRFNHSRHVTAGLKCQLCHGPVETEDRVSQADALSMGMCVTCHRTHREVTLDENGRPHVAKEATPKRLMASTDCSVCHH
jgi:cytochrome c7-like protein